MSNRFCDRLQSAIFGRKTFFSYASSHHEQLVPPIFENLKCFDPHHELALVNIKRLFCQNFKFFPGSNFMALLEILGLFKNVDMTVNSGIRIA